MCSIVQADQRPPPSEPLTNEKGMKGILSKFADKTSVQGIIYIKEARRWASRSFWIFLFMLGTAAVVWQLIDIVQKYMSHPVSTTIDIGYSTLNFPTVTICNMNPLRKSMLHLDPRMARYMQKLSNSWDEGTYAGKAPPTRPNRKVSSQITTDRCVVVDRSYHVPYLKYTRYNNKKLLLVPTYKCVHIHFPCGKTA